MSTGVSKWSAEEDDLLRKLQADGVSPIAMAKQLRRAESSVYRRLDSLAARPVRRERPCMCCGTKFMSDGPHNRLCGRCRTKEKTPFDF